MLVPPGLRIGLRGSNYDAASGKVWGRKIRRLFLKYCGPTFYAVMKNLEVPRASESLEWDKLKSLLISHMVIVNIRAAVCETFFSFLCGPSVEVCEFTSTLQAQASKVIGDHLEAPFGDRLIGDSRKKLSFMQDLILAKLQIFASDQTMSPMPRPNNQLLTFKDPSCVLPPVHIGGS